MNLVGCMGFVDVDSVLSIPSTWDFSMNLLHASCLRRRWMISFNSLYLGFLHESTPDVKVSASWQSFQFPLLGISPWIPDGAGTWGLSLARAFNSLYLGFLHESHCSRIRLDSFTVYFQFPLLGISPWISMRTERADHTIWMTFNSLYLGFLHESAKSLSETNNWATIFQFPLLGISPWISLTLLTSQPPSLRLSIPSTWDFSMNRMAMQSQQPRMPKAFNSLYLGFLHESRSPTTPSSSLICSFNSLYLGFLHESEHYGETSNFHFNTFNSLYLGFLHESCWRLILRPCL